MHESEEQRQDRIMRLLCTLLTMAPPPRKGVTSHYLRRMAEKLGVRSEVAETLVQTMIENGEFTVRPNGNVVLAGSPQKMSAAVVLVHVVLNDGLPL